MPFVFSGQDGGVRTMRSNKKCAAWESMAGTAVVLGVRARHAVPLLKIRNAFGIVLV